MYNDRDGCHMTFNALRVDDDDETEAVTGHAYVRGFDPHRDPQYMYVTLESVRWQSETGSSAGYYDSQRPVRRR